MATRRWRLVVLTVAATAVVTTPMALWAADSFTDVRGDNIHRRDIAWLQDKGVTLGCNPPANTEFCPGQPVLRQQMASFMRRLAEGEIVNAATARRANDANTLRGRRPDELGRIAHAVADMDDDPVIGESHLRTTITAPTAGFLSISYVGEVISTDRNSDVWGCMIGVDGVYPDEGAGYGSSTNSFFLEGCTAQLVVQVAAGDHDIEVAVERVFDTAVFRAGSLSAQFITFDGDGNLATLSQSSEGPSRSQQVERFRLIVSELTEED